MKLATRLQQIADYLRDHPDTRSRCELTVATALSDDTRSFRAMTRAINELVRQGRLLRGHVNGWAHVLSMPRHLASDGGPTFCGAPRDPHTADSPNQMTCAACIARWETNR